MPTDGSLFDSLIAWDIWAGWLVAVGALIGAALVTVRMRRLDRLSRDQSGRLERVADEAWEMRETAERLRSFLDAQDDPITRRDADGRIVYANEAYAALIGVIPESLSGALDPLRVLERGPVTLRHDGSRAHDDMIDTPAGPRWIAWRDVDVRDPVTGRTEIQSVGRDVTDRAATERALAEARDAAQAASRAKSRFVAMISHEIRTPLSGMLGMADLLLGTPLTPDQTTYAKAVRTSGEGLLSLIDEILDLSKIEAGKFDLDPRPFDVARLVEDLVELLAPRAQARGLEIVADIDPAIPTARIGDPARLRQVLLNLAGNGLKFTASGGVILRVEATGRPDRVRIGVVDTGIGIAPEARARIFEEFEQADAGTSRRFGGTGLGLSISRLIVDRMGGTLGVDSTPGLGSTFHFEIDLPMTLSALPVEAVTLRGLAIALVSNATLECEILSRHLRHAGADINVFAALDNLADDARRGIDILIVDRALGEASVEAAARIAGPVRRIVLLTPTERHELPRWRALGFEHYLVKPVRTASLFARLVSAPPLVPAAGPQPVASRSVSGIGLSVLIAEDDPVNAMLARALVAQLGHHAEQVGDGSAAVAAVLAAARRGARFDLVLMDMRMPGMDGLDATRDIRRAEAAEGLPRTPIVALTANAFEEDRADCVTAGMDAFMTKPVDRDKLDAACLALRAVSQAG
jgi:signal transduction histidine kinase/CheY-like chemotaxis protein